MKFLKYLKNLAKSNPAKTIVFFIFALLFIPFFYFDQEVMERNIISSFQDNNNYCYVYRSGESYSVLTFGTEQKIINGRIKYKETHFMVFISGVLIFFIGVFLIISLFFRDEEGWEFRDSWRETNVDYVTCDMEGGMYYYQYKGRLLCASNCRQEKYNILSLIKRFDDDGENLYPLFETTQKKRDKKIDKILN